MNQEMIYSAFRGARKAVPEARDHLGEDAEIDIVAEDGVTPVGDDAERRCQREKERPDQRVINMTPRPLLHAIPKLART